MGKKLFQSSQFFTLASQAWLWVGHWVCWQTHWWPWCSCRGGALTCSAAVTWSLSGIAQGLQIDDRCTCGHLLWWKQYWQVCDECISLDVTDHVQKGCEQMHGACHPLYPHQISRSVQAQTCHGQRSSSLSFPWCVLAWRQVFQLGPHIPTRPMAPKFKNLQLLIHLDRKQW